MHTTPKRDPISEQSRSQRLRSSAARKEAREAARFSVGLGELEKRIKALSNHAVMRNGINKTPISLIQSLLTDLKAINAQYGHRQDDAALSSLLDRIKAQLCALKLVRNPASAIFIKNLYMLCDELFRVHREAKRSLASPLSAAVTTKKKPVVISDEQLLSFEREIGCAPNAIARIQIQTRVGDYYNEGGNAEFAHHWYQASSVFIEIAVREYGHYQELQTIRRKLNTSSSPTTKEEFDRVNSIYLALKNKLIKDGINTALRSADSPTLIRDLNALQGILKAKISDLHLLFSPTPIQEEAESLYCLAGLLEKTNPQEARNGFRTAAVMGHPDAQRRMARYYFEAARYWLAGAAAEEKKASFDERLSLATKEAEGKTEIAPQPIEAPVLSGGGESKKEKLARRLPPPNLFASPVRTASPFAVPPALAR